MGEGAEPKFFIWLGDGWPGVYLVTIMDPRGNIKHQVAVEGASDIPDALKRAEAALPEIAIEGPGEWLTIRPIPIVQPDGSTLPLRSVA